MSLLSNILGKIIPSTRADAKPTPAPADATAQTPGTDAPATAPAAAASVAVDVVAILSAAAAKHKERLDWQRSIVDLLKVIDEDSSLASRQQLAKELNFTGDQSDSATMNKWLHKQVMQKLAEHGGKLPDDWH